MATTDILPFATAVGANVETQAVYAADASTSAGYSSGILPSVKLNKALRQSSFMASVIANFEVGQGVSQPDDGNLSAAVANFQAALRQYIAGTDYIDVTESGGTLALTQTQSELNVIDIGGTLASNGVVTIYAGVAKSWIINNSTTGAFTLTIGYATGATVTIPQGKSLVVWGDGTNIYNTSMMIANLIGLATNMATFLATPTSANLQAAMTSYTGTGLTVFATSPALLGTPTAPTAAVGTSTTQLATTAFAAPAFSKTTNGYTQQADGTIKQSGTVTLSTSGVVAVTFPIAFPTAVTAVTLSHHTGGTLPSDNSVPSATSITTTGFNASSYSSAYQGGTATFIAMGY